MKPKLFNLNLLASLSNFSYLQISVKAKWLNSKKNRWRRIKILFEKNPSLHKKFWSVYREVLSVTWPNFAVVKCNSKISNIYHQVKFRKSIMNRSSIKKLFSKLSQYHKKTPVLESLFKNKMQGFSLATLLKRGSNTAVFL